VINLDRCIKQTTLTVNVSFTLCRNSTSLSTTLSAPS